MREGYDREPLRRAHLSDDPLEQFQRWMQDAVDARVYDPNACSLATVDDGGKPVSRAVLLKGLEMGGFVFYTNYNSRKAMHLAANPSACMHFPWFVMQRQVTVSGEVSKIDDSLADEYFESRPLLSRLGAWASNQSQPLDSRESLENAFLQAVDRWGEHPPRPPHWGGFRLEPSSLEFWQGGPNRLHDRFTYQPTEEKWKIIRLNP